MVKSPFSIQFRPSWHKGQITRTFRLLATEISELRPLYRPLRVFGSAARGEADEESDLDLLVEMEPGRSLLDHAALWLELQEVLGRRVDVVSDRGIKARIRERVLREAVLLLEIQRNGFWICWTRSNASKSMSPKAGPHLNRTN